MLFPSHFHKNEEHAKYKERFESTEEVTSKQPFRVPCIH